MPQKTLKRDKVNIKQIDSKRNSPENFNKMTSDQIFMRTSDNFNI